MSTCLTTGGYQINNMASRIGLSGKTQSQSQDPVGLVLHDIKDITKSIETWEAWKCELNNSYNMLETPICLFGGLYMPYQLPKMMDKLNWTKTMMN